MLFGAAIALLLGGLAVYAFLIEPYWLHATYHRLPAPVRAPLKIALLSDLHTLGLGRRERKLLRLLEAEQPDAILIAGDSRSTSRRATYESIRETLSHLRAPLGVWLVRGNHDKDARRLAQALDGLESDGIHLLLNQGCALRPDVWLAGLDDVRGGRPDPDLALRDAPAGACRIALFHCPVGFEPLAGRVELALAAHTHGGQVHLPFIRPFWLPRGCGSYLEGWYEKNGTPMYVTRGLGTSGLALRFRCRPEVAFLLLEPSH
ncbi:MAG: metallophosphoesterase [Acidobacteria bacterium]|nr:metallophosphoesterase [Acidobacteriota bacterium]